MMMMDDIQGLEFTAWPLIDGQVVVWCGVGK